MPRCSRWLGCVLGIRKIRGEVVEPVTNEATQSSMVELMSAVMDGEASAAETERLFEALADDPDLRARWQRFHHASQLMSISERAAPASEALERRFAAALENELPHSARITRSGAGSPEGRPVLRRWWRFGGGLAVAAAVALAVVALLGRPNTERSAPADPVLAGAEVAIPQGLPVNAVARSPAEGRTEMADIERQTEALMLLHMQHAAVSSRARVMPVAKLAAFTTQSE